MPMLVGRYVLTQQIGKGGFGAVEEYVDDITKESVAIKTIPSRYVNQESRRLVREIDIMCFLHAAHPHVIGYFSIFATRATGLPGQHHGRANEDPLASTAQSEASIPLELNVRGPRYARLDDEEKLKLHHEELTKVVTCITRTDEFNVHIVMPLMKGDLFYFIRLLVSPSSMQALGMTSQYLTQVAVVFAFQICFGLDYLHQCAIIHRDMKPDNVLVRLDASNPYMSTALIADMGLARDAQQSDTIYICTRYYRPPEVITSTTGGNSGIDIWSLGCVLYEMCTGRPLFTMRTALNDRGEWDGAKASLQLEVILNTIGTPSAADTESYMPSGNAKLYLLRSAQRESQLRKFILSHWILECTEQVREMWIDIISRCVAFFPEQRPTAQQLCQHQLFREFNVVYGSNVRQFAASRYVPTFHTPSTATQMENKAAILKLVQGALQDTAPPESDEEDENEDRVEDDDSSNSNSAAHHRPSESNSSDNLNGSSSSTDSGSSSSTHSTAASGQPSNEEEDDARAPHAAAGRRGHSPARAPAKEPATLGPHEPLLDEEGPLPTPNDDEESALPVNAPSFFGVGERSALQPDQNDSRATDSTTTAQGQKTTTSGGNGQTHRGQQQQPHDHSHIHKPSAQYAVSAFVDDDEDDGEEGSAKPGRTAAGRTAMYTTNYPNAAHGSGSGHSYPRVTSPPSTALPHAPSAYLSRLGSGSAFVSMSAGGASHMAEGPVHPHAHSDGSDGSGPVMEDTPPLAPATAYHDRALPRPGARETEESIMSGARPSVFNLDSYRRTDDTGDRGGVGLRPVKITGDARTASAVCHASYCTDLSGSRSAVAGGAQGTSYTSTGMEGSSSLSQPSGGAGGQHHIADANAQSFSAIAGLGWPGRRRLAEEEPYDYFAGGEYSMGPFVSNAAAAVASVTNPGITPYAGAQPSGNTNGNGPATGAASDADSLYLVQLADSGQAVGNLETSQYPPPRAPVPTAESSSFPAIANAELRQRYSVYPHTPRSRHAATSAVLEELGHCTHDPARSSELRQLLSYFTSMKLHDPYAV